MSYEPGTTRTLSTRRCELGSGGGGVRQRRFGQVVGRVHSGDAAPVLRLRAWPVVGDAARVSDIPARARGPDAVLQALGELVLERVVHLLADLEPFRVTAADHAH